jgi:hypothetical protein
MPANGSIKAICASFSGNWQARRAGFHISGCDSIKAICASAFF